ncbi:MAG: hypothetical protein JEY99_18885 [Spirochaetales bacterium]|nr:hypothetical protein [Spirochaetales bacterium]
MKKTIIFLLLLTILIPGLLFAGGGGGMMWQRQASEFPFATDWDLPDTNLGLHMMGGYGYGIDPDGRINGGFGYGILSDEDEVTGELIPGAISGGFGGVVNGYQLMSRPLHIAFVSYAGLGGLYQAATSENDEKGWFAVSLEVDVEVGLPLFGWFVPVVYAGYQYIGSVFTDDNSEVFQTYSPVLGCRLTFGDLTRG